MAQYFTGNNSLRTENKSNFEMMMLNNQSLYSAPFEVAVARGLVPGVAGLSISGFQGSVSSSWIPLWDGGATAYTYPVSAGAVRIWSSSASDTNIVVNIFGLDENYDLQTETVTLTNGTTGVLTTKSFLRINSIVSTTNAVGTISCGNTGKTATYALIPIGTTRSSMTIYTVPNGYVFYLTQVNVYTNQNGSQYTNYRSYTLTPAGVATPILQFPLILGYNSVKVVPRPYPAKTDIQWQFNSTGTSQIGAQIEGYLIQGG